MEQVGGHVAEHGESFRDGLTFLREFQLRQRFRFFERDGGVVRQGS